MSTLWPLAHQLWVRSRTAGLAVVCLAVAWLTTGCDAAPTAAAPPVAAPPPTPRVGYDRLQQAYSLWQLLDRARETTGRLQTWREVDPDSGSMWEYGVANRVRYRIVDAAGRSHEGYESDEMDCWRRDDGRWDRRPIARRAPAAAALSDDLFSGAWRVSNEGTADLDGVAVQVVRFNQRAGDRRWSTLARDREVRVWLAVEDALPRRVEIAVPSFRTPEWQSARLYGQFDEPTDLDVPCD